MFGMMIISVIIVLVIFYTICILEYIYQRNKALGNGRCPGERDRAEPVIEIEKHYVEPEEEVEDFDIEQLKLEISEVKPMRFDSEGNMVDKYLAE